MALARFNGALVALVADEDDSSIHVLETKPPKEIAVTKLPGIPGQVLVTQTGQVLVALRDKGTVAVLEAQQGDPRRLALRGTIDTGGDPIALAMTPGESTLVVATGFSHEVTGWSLANRTRTFRVDVPREPRAIVMSTNGSKAFVSHAIGGTLSVVDVAAGTMASVALFTGAKRFATQGFALARHQRTILVPTILAEPEPSTTYYGAGTEIFAVTAINETTNANLGTTPRPFTADWCLLPRAATMMGNTLLVGCAGTEEMSAFEVDNKALTVGKIAASATAMAYDDVAGLIVWSQMTRTFTVGTTSVTVAGGPPKTPVARGRALFHDVSGKLAGDRRACASCHPDGRDDGLVWSTPDGKRQTTMLAGRVEGRALFGWTRNEKTFQGYVAGTSQRLRGRGFSASELADLEAYVISLKPLTPALHDERLERGALAFVATGCASCHSGSNTTDGLTHRIQNSEIATPSLRFVGTTAPYFHDGRYKDLRALLTSTDEDMGRARTLPAADLDALEAYVKSL
jgi:hypothetical protein